MTIYSRAYFKFPRSIQKMRDSQLQTPQRDQHSANRKQKTTPDLNKNQRKVRLS